MKVRKIQEGFAENWQEKNRKGKCAMQGCKKPLATYKKAGRIYSRPVCGSCFAIGCVKRNPLTTAYSKLRSNAKVRGKAFDLTLEQFEQFCKETNYIALKGRKPTDYSIDRIDADKGYSLDNIRMVTVYENGYKGRLERKSISAPAVDISDIVKQPSNYDNVDLPF